MGILLLGTELKFEQFEIADSHHAGWRCAAMSPLAARAANKKTVWQLPVIGFLKGFGGLALGRRYE